MWLVNSEKLLPSTENGEFGQEEGPLSSLASGEGPADMDVMVSADVLKQLFKLPYSRGRVQILLHRLGDTLVLDKGPDGGSAFFMSDGKFRSAGKGEGKGEGVEGEEAGVMALPVRKKNRAKTSEAMLYSKFIYHSTPGSDVSELPVRAASSAEIEEDESKMTGPHQYTNPPPVPPPAFQKTFNWSFRDLSMLVGSNVVIFGNKEHPAVSLQLANADKELSASKLLEYWVDNVVAGIPELALCFHKQGIVQQYRLVATDRILGLLQPPLDPAFVEGYGERLFGWLKDSTSPFCSYLLVREAGREQVDLVPLGSGDDEIEDRDLKTGVEVGDASRSSPGQPSPATPGLAHSPFVVQAGMLCLRLGQRRVHGSSAEERELGRKFLAKATELLDGHVHPVAWLSAQESLARAFLPAGWDRAPSQPSSAASTVAFPLDDKNYIAAAHHLTQAINLLKDDTVLGLRFGGTLTNLSHLAAQCYLTLAHLSKAKGQFGAPVHWLHLASEYTPWKSQVAPDRSNAYFLGSLLELAGDIALEMPRRVTSNEIKLGFEAELRRRARAPGGWLPLPTAPLKTDVESNTRVAAMCYFRAAMALKESADAGKAAAEESGGGESIRIRDLPATAALSMADTRSLPEVIAHRNELARALYVVIVSKLGNARNELGKFYLASSRLTKAAQFFQHGLESFNEVGDAANSALILCNLGKLMRIYAQGEADAGGGAEPGSAAATTVAMSVEEKHNHARAIGYFVSARETLGERKVNPGVWDSVLAGLGGAYLAYGVRVSDLTPTAGVAARIGLTVEEMIETASDYMTKALRTFESISDAGRAGTAAWYLARWYGRMVMLPDVYLKPRRQEGSDGGKGVNQTKLIRSRAELTQAHIDMALRVFSPASAPREFSTMKLEAAKLAHYVASGPRAETLQSALGHLLDIRFAASDPREKESNALVLYKESNPGKKGKKGKKASGGGDGNGGRGPPPRRVPSCQELSAQLSDVGAEVRKELLAVLRDRVKGGRSKSEEAEKKLYRSALTSSKDTWALLYDVAMSQ